MDDFFNKDKCDRCGKDLSNRTQNGKQFIMSWFTEETICIQGDDCCSKKEDEIKAAIRKQGKNPGDYEGCGYVPAITNSGRYIAGGK